MTDSPHSPTTPRERPSMTETDTQHPDRAQVEEGLDQWWQSLRFAFADMPDVEVSNNSTFGYNIGTPLRGAISRKEALAAFDVARQSLFALYDALLRRAETAEKALEASRYNADAEADMRRTLVSLLRAERRGLQDQLDAAEQHIAALREDRDRERLTAAVQQAARHWSSCSYYGGCLPDGVAPVADRGRWCSQCVIIDAARQAGQRTEGE